MFDDITSDPIANQLVSNATPFSSMLIRREALDDGTLLDPRFNLVGDKYLTLRVALGGWRFAAVPEAMLFLRTHGASMRYSAIFRQEYLEQVLGAIEEVAADPRLSPRYAKTVSRAKAWAYFSTAWLMIDRGTAEERRAARPYLSEAMRRDPRLAPKAGKQLVKAFVRGLRAEGGNARA